MRYAFFLLTLTSILYAEDQDFPDVINNHDVRFTYMVLPTQVDTHIKNRVTNASLDAKETADSVREFSVGYQFTHYVGPSLAVLVGGNIDYIRSLSQTSSTADTSDNYGPSAHIGFGLRPEDIFTLELLGFVGGGKSEEEIQGVFSKTLNSSSGHYYQYGAEMRGVFTLGKGIQLFATVGYVGLTQTLFYDYDASLGLDPLEVNHKIDGGMWGLGVGCRF